MNQTPFKGIHGLQQTAGTSANRLVGHTVGHAHQGFLPACPIAFGIQHHPPGGAVTDNPVQIDIGQELEGIQVLAFLSNENVRRFRSDFKK
jgi:hypothetical protein